MSKIQSALRFLKEDRGAFMAAIVQNFFRWLPDKSYLQLLYRFKMGHRLDLKNPKTFTEKLQWLKVNDYKPEYTKMVDKLAAKDYVASRIGEEYIIPTLGVWDKVEDIDWDSLPDQFVLKTTHGGGGCGVVVCSDKTHFDKAKAIEKLQTSMHSNAGKTYREKPYLNVPRKIIAEKFMAERKAKGNAKISDLPDYKFFCFNGKPYYCQVIRDRHTKETIDFYDMEWNHMPFVGLNPVARNGLTPVDCPENYDEMKDICRKLAKDIPFVRVDLYVIDDKKYFGELTFYPASGFGVFTPEEWNGKLGDLLTLPNATGGKYMIVNGVISRLKTEYDELKDYKFFSFNGKVRFFKVDFGRFVEHHANYYDIDGNLLPFGEKGLEPDPNHVEIMPVNLNNMITIAEKLSGGFKFLRVDLYNVKGKIYFGELTFYPASGMGAFVPEEWDEKLGRMLNLDNHHVH